MIDEKKLIKDLKEYKIDNISINGKNIIDIINEQPKTDWIPCEERLPSDTAIHEVTAKLIDGRLYTEFAYYDESREEWRKFDDDGIVNVVAWKEGSEPYKKEGAE